MRKALLAFAALALLLAACGGSATAGVATLEDTTDDEAAELPEIESDPEQSLLAFTQCMRDNGIDLGDPTMDSEGNLQLAPNRDFQTGDFDREAAREAFTACSEHLEGVALGFGEGGFDFTELQDSLLEFSACMRQYIPDFPDPDFSNFGLGGEGDNAPGPGAGGPFGGAIDPNDPAVQEAAEACQDVFAGFTRRGFGPGGGRGGQGGGD